MKLHKQLLSLLLFFFTLTIFAQSTEKPFWEAFPKPDKWVTDYEDIFTDNQELALIEMVTAYEKKTGVSIIIVTLNSPKGLDQITVDIATQWLAPKKVVDNSILIAISKGMHRMRIQNGNKIKETISDAETKDIINNVFVPEFQKNNYYEATSNGIMAISKQLKHLEKPVTDK
ncbi:TPM domain-containing protein [Flavobacterium zepuense]|uniref:TPM domain-containing protein n=1 Tax=Flavobacterium zepuense TaxID=2593302 RepID=A0A552V662_9FLAO|nr:TPM domain-containing protein [Flavobacterium zepuense]TRW25937.1 TPM domain-containing protein [Flavobacterium zepuense]